MLSNRRYSAASVLCSALRHAARAYSSSGTHKGHYDTLGVPHHATKHQIKSQYYKLSKKFHPDVTNDPQSTSAFQAVTEAYTVLGDEDKRRSYDRSLSASSSWSPAMSNLYETRHRGATHAWEYSNRPGRRRAHPHRRAQQPTWTAHRGSDDAAFRGRVSHVIHRSRPGPTDADRVRRESSLWRALQVIGIVMFVATVGRWGVS